MKNPITWIVMIVATLVTIYLYMITFELLREAGVFYYIAKEGPRITMKQMLTGRFLVDMIIMLIHLIIVYVGAGRSGAWLFERVENWESKFWKKRRIVKENRMKAKGTYDYNKFKYHD